MKKIILTIILLSILGQISFSQVYTEKQTRHRFAQLNMGLDWETNFGGHTNYLDKAGNIKTTKLSSTYTPRFVIGGTHFWGHADFYIAIPLSSPKIAADNQEIQYLRGVETAFKYYPRRIEHRKFSPYIGFSIAPFYFEQHNNFLAFKNGPELYSTNFPLLTGVTFLNKNHLFEFGLAWNYANKQTYPISRLQKAAIKTPPLYLNLSYRYMLETTLSAEKNWESGQTKVITEKLTMQKKLNGVYVGVGLSAAFWSGESSYNTAERTYIEKYGISILPDFTFGYYLHRPDINIALGYRGYGTSTNTYGTRQVLQRNSLVLETTKCLFDYHGFVPFIGPAISYENLSFKEQFEQQQAYEVSKNKIGYGITFGWDIRPTRIQTWILRTNLRWYPNLKLEVKGEKKISFDTLEFNFIQLIIYPNRLFK